jgi:uncharacterized protein
MSSALMLIGLSTAVVGTSFLSGILGMAGGMVLMGILLALMPVTQAMVLHGITQLASNGWRAVLWRAAIDWRVFRGYALGCAGALLLFGWFQLALSRPLVLIALGATPFLVYLLPRRTQLNVDRRGHPFVCGLISVSLQLLSGVSGPLLDSFFLASRLDRKAVVATKAACQTLSHAAKIAYFGALLANGAAGTELHVAAILVACAVIGTTASRRVLEKMSDTDFRSWTRRAVLGIGGFYLASGLWGLAA